MESTTEVMEHSTAITNYQNIEEIYIKEEPLEETSLDCELYENILQNVKKEERISIDDSQIDKVCNNTITRNDIRKSKNGFCCVVCNKSFMWKQSLTRHIKTHEIKEEPLEENALDCELYQNVLQSGKKEECIFDDNQMGKACDNLNTRNNDTNSNLEEIYIKGEPLEETSLDGELYENIQSVKKKKYISDDDDEIDKACDNPVNNNIRKSKNTNSNDFCCAVCNKNFTRKTGLISHMKIHSGEKEFECATCNKSFSEKSYLKAHVKIHIEIKDYKCTICNKQFTQKIYLSRHMKNHNGIKDYQCPTCYKSFTHNSYLKSHMKYHSAIKAYKCSTCNKSFRQLGHLKEHMRIHSGIKDYECEICKKQFTCKGHLTKHKKIHTGIKAYKCPTCNKSFLRNSYLKVHMIIHSGIKNYKCAICSKLFKHIQNLSAHMKTKHTRNKNIKFDL